MKYRALDLFGRLQAPETQREALELVAAMIEYRTTVIGCLEQEICRVTEEMRSTRSTRTLKRTMAQISTDMDRVRQLVQDNQYDAMNLISLLRLGEEAAGKDRAGIREEEVRYIS